MSEVRKARSVTDMNFVSKFSLYQARCEILLDVYMLLLMLPNRCELKRANNCYENNFLVTPKIYSVLARLHGSLILKRSLI